MQRGNATKLFERLDMKNFKHAAIALLLGFNASLAFSQSNQDYYGEVGYMALNIKNENNGFAIAPRLARFIVGKELDKNLAVEGVYGLTVSKDSAVLGNVKYTGQQSFYGAYLKPKMEAVKDVEVFARVGALHGKYEDEASAISKTKLSYGFGVQAQFTKDVYGQLDYMSYYKQDGMTARGFTISLGTRF